MLIIYWTLWVNYSLLHCHNVGELDCTISKDYALYQNGLLKTDWKPFLSSLQLSCVWKKTVSIPWAFYFFRISKISQENKSYNQAKVLGVINSATLHYFFWKVIHERINCVHMIHILIKHMMTAGIGHGSLNIILLWLFSISSLMKWTFWVNPATWEWS